MNIDQKTLGNAMYGDITLFNIYRSIERNINPYLVDENAGGLLDSEELLLRARVEQKGFANPVGVYSDTSLGIKYGSTHCLVDEGSAFALFFFPIKRWANSRYISPSKNGNYGYPIVETGIYSWGKNSKGRHDTPFFNNSIVASITDAQSVTVLH